MVFTFNYIVPSGIAVIQQGNYENISRSRIICLKCYLSISSLKTTFICMIEINFISTVIMKARQYNISVIIVSPLQILENFSLALVFSVNMKSIIVLS